MTTNFSKLKITCLLINSLFFLVTVDLALAQYSVGDTVANFTLRDCNGNNVSLNNYQGSCILLHFCTTWCPDCNSETPLVENNIWQPYRMRGLQVIGINIGENAATVAAWIDSLSITYPWLLDRDAFIWADYGGPEWMVPRYVIIDPTMVVRYLKVSYHEAELIAVIEEYLPVHGNVIHVPADYGTIQAAIDAASEGDTVAVAPGVYQINSTIVNERIDHLQLLGSRNEDGSNACVITAAGNQGIFNCISFQNVSWCKIAGFEVTKGHSGIVLDNCRHCLITKNYIHNNDELSAWHGNGIGIFNSELIDVTYCVIDSNEFHGIQIDNSESIKIINNTILNVYRYDGIALGTDPKAMTIKNNIITLTTDEAIELSGTPTDFIHDYNCYWQNGQGPIKGLPLSSHEFILYPNIAAAHLHDYYLLPDSPCIGAGESGANIGALGAKVFVKIHSISDIANDQGKQVRIIWAPDYFDGRSNRHETTHYAIWRRVADRTGLSRSPSYPMHRISELIPQTNSSECKIGRLMTANNELWDFVISIPACQFTQYACVATTLADSTAAGIPWSVFMVSAHCSDPGKFVLSDPDSGYSVDNLAPSPPTGVTISQHKSGTDWQAVIRWNGVIDEDFDYYAVYRETESGFDPATAIAYGTTSDTFFVDARIDSGHSYCYQVSAIDFSGNESLWSEQGSIVAEVAALFQHSIPNGFALLQNFPNPFNAGTTFYFQLPTTCPVVIQVYNSLGQEIVELINEKKPAGYYTIHWDGKDDGGNQVVSGIYLYQIKAGDFVSSKKMALLR
ncbi:MAG: redoxin domain-containing protein [Candidatus Zhuqueibacterota bacterium]